MHSGSLIETSAEFCTSKTPAVVTSTRYRLDSGRCLSAMLSWSNPA